MFNGGIDREIYGVDFLRETLSLGESTINFKGALAVKLRLLGNVPIEIDGNFQLSLSDETICFENIAGLDFAKNKKFKWMSDGVVNPDYRLEVIRYFLVEK